MVGFTGSLVINKVLYENIDQIRLNKSHGPMHYKIGVTCIYHGHVFFTLVITFGLIHLFYNSSVHVMNSRVSGQCVYIIKAYTCNTV